MRFLSKFVFLTLVSVLSFSSCASLTQKTTTVTTVDVTHTGVLQKPIIVDLSVEPLKVRGTASGANVQAVKNEAINNALTNARNADVLVEPNFTITTRAGNVTVEVSGYPATYTNFRTVSDSDTTWLKHSNAIYTAKRFDTIERQSVTSEQQKKRRGWIATVGGGILLVILIIAASGG